MLLSGSRAREPRSCHADTVLSLANQETAAIPEVFKCTNCMIACILHAHRWSLGSVLAAAVKYAAASSNNWTSWWHRPRAYSTVARL